MGLAQGRAALAAIIAHHQLAHPPELHVSRGLLMASTGASGHVSDIEQHEDGDCAVGAAAGYITADSTPLSPRRAPRMTLLKDGLLRHVAPGAPRQELYVALFADAVLLGFADVGPRHSLVRAFDLAYARVYDTPHLSDDWRHCFVLANADHVCGPFYLG